MRKGWFVIPGVQMGDRTLEQQLQGLGPFMAGVQGKTVLDLGCAEGLVLRHLVAQCGAKSGTGVEIVPEHVEEARRQCEGLPIGFHCHDLNDTAWVKDFEHPDVVLMLAILHKLRNPKALLKVVTRVLRPECIVLRTAGSTPGFVLDARSGMIHFDVLGYMGVAGYHLERITDGPFKEWTGVYRRIFSEGTRGHRR